MGYDTQMIMKLLKSEKFAWVVGAALVSGFALVAYTYVGWLGIGGIGIFGLYLTQRMELHGADADVTFDYHVASPQLLAQQQKARDNLRPEEKFALEARENSRKRTRYLMNTFWVAITALGFSMFASSQ